MAEIIEFEDPRFCACLEDNCKEFLEFSETILHMKGRESKKPRTITEAFEVYFILLEAVHEYI